MLLYVIPNVRIAWVGHLSSMVGVVCSTDSVRTEAINQVMTYIDGNDTPLLLSEKKEVPNYLQLSRTF